ncbi:MAG TPA: EamA family transporter RarD [Burkholderiaceae bacterium]|nr:EamA family transporter RarD [Burkholderiaceae bacterium]
MPSGLVFGALAFVWWGLFPLYFLVVTTVPAPQILAHRVVWCLLFLVVVLTARRQWAWLRPVMRQPKVLGAFIASALLIGANWLAYIWAVGNGHVIDASLGYFITPLVNVALGVTLLHERLRRAQWLALALAALGVVWLTVLAGRPPWVALLLAVTFGGYGLLRKIAVLGALEGLTLETLLLAPLAALVLALAAQHGTASFPAPDALTNAWMIALGPITAVPLLLFAAAARRLSMATLGIVQYLGPSIQFVVGLWVFREPFSATRLAGFALIWLALVLYTLDGWRVSRQAAAAPA